MGAPLAAFRQSLASAVASRQGLSEETAHALAGQIREPEAGRGDLALPCFQLAKSLGLPPPAAAQKIAESLKDHPDFAQVEAAGPYVNVTLATALLVDAVVPAARVPGFGGSDSGAGKTVVIDFSSPNIAKPLAFHHIRSTVIGAALGRIHRALGWKVVGINYLGDWGKQFGLLATGFQRYGDPQKRADAKHLVEVYVKANAEADVDKVKATLEAPKLAAELLAQVAAAQAALAAASGDDKKKAEKNLKSLEKKLRVQRGIGEEADVLAGSDAWLAELEAKRAAAELARPSIEARDQEARMFLKRLEEGEATALAEWKEFRETSIREFERIYAKMGIEFTSLEGESRYTNVLEATVEKVRQKPGTAIDQGAEIVKLEGQKKGEPPPMVKTKDGTTLYLTRDIAAAMDRYERFHFDKSLYVVAADQSLHFSQLFAVLKAMGNEWAEKCTHVAFGRVHGMSTRRGSVVFLDEVLEESVSKAREICVQSDRIDAANLDEAVEAIGVGAVVFGDLKNLRGSDYTFKWEEVLKFDGHTAPYVQFAHARACSILQKGGGVPAAVELRHLVLPEERAVLMALARYPEALERAASELEPSLVTRAILDVAQTTASWLTAGNQDRSRRVLVEGDEALKGARLALIDAVRNTLQHGLGLLGVRAPRAM
jgi:arginyl-tRNA synthetase